MNDNNSWQKPLDNFLAKNSVSIDSRVLARVLSNDSQLDDKKCSEQEIADMERALHIEQHLDEIGLQPIPTNLVNKLQAITKKEQSNNIVFGKFGLNWKSVSALAATITAVALLNINNINTSENQQPSIAEVKHAQQELSIALQYISFAKTKSAHKIKQTFDENIHQPLNQSLFKPLNHFKETS